MEDEILQQLRHFNSALESLVPIRKSLEVRVLNHFTRHISEVINPKLPEGYSLKTENEISTGRKWYSPLYNQNFSDCLYGIVAGSGCINYPHPMPPSRLAKKDYEDIWKVCEQVKILFDSYTDSTPWIGKVEFVEPLLLSVYYSVYGVNHSTQQ